MTTSRRPEQGHSIMERGNLMDSTLGEAIQAINKGMLRGELVFPRDIQYQLVRPEMHIHAILNGLRRLYLYMY